MINPNDPKEWSKMDWDDPVPLKIRSDATVNRSRSALGKRNNPEFQSTMAKVAEERNRNQTYRKNLKQGCQDRDNSYQAEINARPDVQEKISKAMKGYVKTAEHEAKVAASNRAKPNDPVWREAHAAGLAKRDRLFHAGEYGVFPSLSAAARHVMEQGLLTNALKKFEKWKTTDPTNYYFIEKQ